MRRPLLALSVLTAMTLGACGVKGDLERPDPIFGKKDKAEITSQSSTPVTDP